MHWLANLGRTLLTLGEPGLAEAPLREAFRLDEGLASARLDLGLALGARDPEAGSQLELAAAARPEDAATRRALGFALAVVGRSGRAIEELRCRSAWG